MAYISTADVKKIRVALKEKFPAYKFSVRKDNNIAVAVNVMKGPAFKPYEEHDRYENTRYMRDLNNGNFNINHHYLDRYGENEEFFEEVVKIIKTAPNDAWYDNSDMQIDYFDTAYYIHLKVGKWDKDYEAVA